MLRKPSLKPFPSLTLSGRISEFVGFVALAVGLRTEQRPLMVIGCVLFTPAVLALLMTWLQVRGLQAVVRRPRITRALEGSPVQVTLWSPAGACGLLIRDTARRSLGMSLYLERLPARKSTVVTGTETFTRRGRVRAGPLLFACSRPLGLAEAGRRLGGGASLLVLPALGEISGPVLRLVDVGERSTTRAEIRRGSGAETRFIRPFLPGDPPRRIHWRSTARMGQLMVRETEDEQGGVVVVAMGGMLDGTPAEARQMETAVSLAATLLHRGVRMGRDLFVLVPGQGEGLLLRGGDRRALLRAEEQLALLDAGSGWPDWSLVPSRLPVERSLLIHAGRGDLPRLPAGVTPIDARRAVQRGWFRPRGGRGA